VPCVMGGLICDIVFVETNFGNDPGAMTKQTFCYSLFYLIKISYWPVRELYKI